MTGQPDWRVVNEDETVCITDIHSASRKISIEGTPYSSW